MGRPPHAALPTALLLTLAAAACTAPARPGPAPVPSASASGAPVRDATPPSDAASAGPDAGPDASPTLAADLDRRTRDARTRFGPAARIVAAGGLFVLVESGRPTPLFLEAAALVDRATAALLAHFARRPDRGVTIVTFSDHAAYVAYCAMRYAAARVDYGVYRADYREIAVDLSGGRPFLPTLTHEIVHPMIEADFPDAPLWFQEAVASLFEAPVFAADGSIHGEPRNWRHPRLQRALASPSGREEVRLDALFRMTPKEFHGRAHDAGAAAVEDAWLLHYATVRAFAAWLDGQGELWPFYAAWRDGFEDDPDGDKAFARVMGESPRDANAAWVRGCR